MGSLVVGRWAWIIALLALGCDQPIPAVPTSATATKDLVICWRDPDQGDDASNASMIHAMAKALRGAGYQVVTKGICEISLEWQLASRGHENEFDSSYREATLTVRDGSTFIDKVQLEWGPGQVPTDDPNRLAILLVNALNASAKVAQYASDNADKSASPMPSANPKQRFEPSF